MEPFNKANNVCVQLVELVKDYFFPQNGKDNKPSITTWVTLSEDQTKDTKPTR